MELIDIVKSFIHELNNPLTVLKLTTDDIEQELESGGYLEERLIFSVERQQRSISKISSLVSKLIKVTKEYSDANTDFDGNKDSRPTKTNDFAEISS